MTRVARGRRTTHASPPPRRAVRTRALAVPTIVATRADALRWRSQMLHNASPILAALSSQHHVTAAADASLRFACFPVCAIRMGESSRQGDWGRDEQCAGRPHRSRLRRLAVREKVGRGTSSRCSTSCERPGSSISRPRRRPARRRGKGDVRRGEAVPRRAGSPEPVVRAHLPGSRNSKARGGHAHCRVLPGHRREAPEKKTTAAKPA